MRRILPSISAWAVGVITAPRPLPSIVRTVAHIERAGWTEGGTIYAEPGSCVDPVTGWPPIDRDRWRLVRRPEGLGLWPNWISALSDMVATRSDADAYMLCEDDVVLADGLRRYCELTLWPSESVAVCSPYCPTDHASPDHVGWHVVHRGRKLVGAQCYIFPPDAARFIVADMAQAPPDKYQDAWVGIWAEETGRLVYYHTPSIAQHTGGQNSSRKRFEPSIRRLAEDFTPSVAQKVLASLERGQSLAAWPK